MCLQVLNVIHALEMLLKNSIIYNEKSTRAMMRLSIIIIRPGHKPMNSTMSIMRMNIIEITMSIEIWNISRY